MKRRRLDKLFALARKLQRIFPLTGLGVLVLGGCGLAFGYYGLGQQDLVLLALGGVGLGIGALCLLLTIAAALLTRRAAKARVDADPLTLECAFWAPTGFAIPSRWYLPFISIGWQWQSPRATVRTQRKHQRLVEQIRPERRDSHGRIVRHFTVSDIFGLTSVSFSISQQRVIQLLPWTGNLKQMDVVRGMAGGGDISHPQGPAKGDRIDMRRYVPGDPIRFVLWKVFAKTRDLVVRAPEQAISPSQQTAAYLVVSDADEPAAGAVRAAMDVGALGTDWLVGADGCEQVADSEELALEVLTRSARATEGQSGAGLGNFLKKATSGATSRAVVFVPARPGPWLKRVLAATRSQSGVRPLMDFVIGTDGVRRQPAPSRWWRWLWRSKGPLKDDVKLTDTTELAEVVKALGATQTNVIVVDRVAGQIFSHARLVSGSEA